MKIAKLNKPKNRNNNKNPNCLDKILCDSKKSRYYNYNKKTHFAKFYLKPAKTSFDLSNLYANDLG